MRDNGLRMLNKVVELLKLPKEIFTEVTGRKIISMEKENINLRTVIIIKGIFIKAQDKAKENTYGQTKAVTKEIGKQIKCKDMESIQLLMVLLLRVGFKKINSLDEINAL